ncbi:MAG: HEAT repeat domain-containing protein, partial [Planctomycetes bacterium]|nr:HEAT repeat domain-containing protein [Planctomycetota bacterium]
MLRTLILTAAVGLGGAGSAHGLGQEEFGPSDQVSSSSDWPVGVREVLVHPSRVYSFWVNGNEQAYFEGDLDAINEVIDLYSKIRMKDHDLIVLPGTGEARSFSGQTVYYMLGFEVPSGIYLHHAMEKAKTGLYTLTPRLTLKTDSDLAKDLDRIRIPGNITLKALPYEPADCIRTLKSSDRYDQSLAARRLGEIGPPAVEAVGDLIEALDDTYEYVRANAAWALGQIGRRDDTVIGALEKAAKDENDSVRKNAAEALSILESPADPADLALRQQVADFLKQHPQNAPTTRPASTSEVPAIAPAQTRPTLKPGELPTAADLLAKLRRFDDLYRGGFTASGTHSAPSSSGYPVTTKWLLTMGDGRLVLVQRPLPVADDAATKPADRKSGVGNGHPDPAWSNQETENVIFTGPAFIAQRQVHRIVTPDHKDGVDSTTVSLEKPGTTYDFLVGKVLWTTGRGYANRIDEITEIKPGPDGLIRAKAGGSRGSPGESWELLVDPRADYMVRSAKLFRRGQTEPWVVVTNSGLRRSEGRCLPERAVWTMGSMGTDVPYTFETLSAKPDLDLIHETEANMQARPKGTATVMDSRLRPDVNTTYRDDRIDVSKVVEHNAQEGADVESSRQAAEDFVLAVSEDNDEVIADLVQPNSPATRKLKQLKQLAGIQKLRLRNVHLADGVALISTSSVGTAPQGGPLLIRMTQHDGKWLIDDIDLNVADSVT